MGRQTVPSSRRHCPLTGSTIPGAAPQIPAALRVTFGPTSLVPPIRGCANDAFRRRWATERKHHSIVDVAKEGGWRSVETLQRCYMQADERTMYEVMSEPRRAQIGGKP